MIGGLFKSSSKVAMIAAAGLLSGGVAAKAADLGGNCCADLEERVAELEATTARKGNRKVSLKISGAMTASILWHNDDTDARDGEIIISQAGGASGDPYFRFSGSAKINSTLSAGFVMDLNIDANTTNSVYGLVEVDDNYIWIKDSRLGAVKIGRVDSALDGLFAAGKFGKSTSMLGDEASRGGFYDAGYVYGRNNFDGDADGDIAGTIRYESPVLGGIAQVVASYNIGSANNFVSDSDIWAVSLTLAHEFGAFRVKGRIGIEETDPDAAADANETEWAATLGIQHVPTGLYVTGWYGDEEDPGAANSDGWGVQVGMEAKLNSLGKTYFWGMYGETSSTNLANAAASYNDVSAWGVGIIQAVDAAAMTLQFDVQQYECALTVGACTDDMTVFEFGTVIKF